MMLLKRRATHIDSIFSSVWHWIVVIILTTSCALEFNNPTTGTTSSESCTSLENTLTVEPLYPTFTRWNDYVQTASTTTACSAADVGDGNHTNCIHAGERRRVDLPVSVTSCSGLSASDTLGVFDWECNDTGSPVYFYSTKLANNKGLRDLIDSTSGTAFNNNSVSITNSSSCSVYSTTSTNTWWTNSISVLPNLSTATAWQTLNTAYQIYTVPTGTSGSTNGFYVNADGISVVTLGSEVLSYYGDATVNFNAQQNIFVAENADFVWFEVSVDGSPAVLATNADTGVVLNGVDFGRIHNTTIKNVDQMGLWYSVSSAVRNSLVTNLIVENAANTTYSAIGIWVPAANNTFSNVRVANISRLGAQAVVEHSIDPIWNKVTIANVNGAGFLINDCCGLVDPVVTELVVIGTSDSGVTHGSAATFGFFTALFVNDSSSGGGIASRTKNNTTTFQGLSVYAGGSSYQAGGAGGGTGTQYVRNAVQNNGEAVRFQGVAAGNDDNRVFEGLWLSADVTGCADEGTGPSGNWIDGTCNYGSATPAIAPDSTTLQMNSSILGRVASDSAAPQAAQSAHASITDWTSLDSFYRGWGKVNTGQATELHQDHKGNCTAADTCNIYDVRYSSTASAIHNVNGTFSSSSCPTSVDSSTASNVITDNSGLSRTFLVNAVEIMFDGIGNDNGLCESSESCLFAPHLGAYLGEGDYENNGSCDYTGGNGVTNYKIYGYPTTEASE